MAHPTNSHCGGPPSTAARSRWVAPQLPPFRRRPNRRSLRLPARSPTICMKRHEFSGHPNHVSASCTSTRGCRYAPSSSLETELLQVARGPSSSGSSTSSATVESYSTTISSSRANATVQAMVVHQHCTELLHDVRMIRPGHDSRLMLEPGRRRGLRPAAPAPARAPCIATFPASPACGPSPDRDGPGSVLPSAPRYGFRPQAVKPSAWLAQWGTLMAVGPDESSEAAATRRRVSPAAAATLACTAGFVSQKWMGVGTPSIP